MAQVVIGRAVEAPPEPNVAARDRFELVHVVISVHAFGVFCALVVFPISSITSLVLARVHDDAICTHVHPVVVLLVVLNQCFTLRAYDVGSVQSVIFCISVTTILGTLVGPGSECSWTAAKSGPESLQAARGAAQALALSSWLGLITMLVGTYVDSIINPPFPEPPRYEGESPFAYAKRRWRTPVLVGLLTASIIAAITAQQVLGNATRAAAAAVLVRLDGLDEAASAAVADVAKGVRGVHLAAALSGALGALHLAFGKERLWGLEP